jgi:hypothetical protein
MIKPLLILTLLGSSLVPAQAPPKVTVLTLIASPSSGGFVNGGGQYQMNTVVTISASPYSGYSFLRWGDSNTAPVRQITIKNKDATYYAYFVKAPLPPPSNLTNSLLYWTLPNVPVSAYRVIWSPGSNVLTFSTNYTIWGLTNGAVYNAAVRSIATNGLEGGPSCSVTWVAGGGKASCP